MINDKVEMKDVRKSLQDLSVSAPHAQANMLRYVAALSVMLGRRGDAKALPREPEIIATFQFTPAEENIQMAVAGRRQIDTVIIAFDIDDPTGPPAGIGIIRPEGDMIASDGRCGIWSPPGDGRAIIVSKGHDACGYFAFRRGAPLRHIQRPLPGDLEAGLRRGTRNLIALANSKKMREIEGGFMHVVNSQGPGQLSADTTHLSGRWRELDRPS